MILSLPCALALVPFLPAVLHVGTGQPFATIGQALAVAAPGDLILVDPGTYPAFTVTVPVTIAASGGTFAVTQSTGTPAITISGTTATVAVDGARIVLAQLHAPAITVSNCTGDVRLQNVFVDTASNLVGTSARAAIEVSSCADVILETVTVAGAAPRSGSTTNPDGTNDALSAVRFVDCNLLLRDCTLRGYDAPSGGAFGGDAVRVVTTGALAAPSAWFVPNATQFLVGGASAGHGGNCLHQVGSTAVAAEYCGGINAWQPGAGGVLAGGFFAINDDGGVISPGVGRFVVGCPDVLAAATSAPAVTTTGTTFSVGVADSGGGASCMLSMSFGSTHLLSVPSVTGRVLLDLTNAQTIGFGTTPAAFPITVPANPALAGIQLTTQGLVFSPSGTSATVTATPAFVSVR